METDTINVKSKGRIYITMPIGKMMEMGIPGVIVQGRYVNVLNQSPRVTAAFAEAFPKPPIGANNLIMKTVDYRECKDAGWVFKFDP